MAWPNWRIPQLRFDINELTIFCLSVYCTDKYHFIIVYLQQVDDLKAKLAVQEEELQQKNEDADKLIEVVEVETEKVSKEKAIANEEELKVQVIAKVKVCSRIFQLSI